ncbi:hypothetical protein NQ315_010495 [Exocentrus adspersus]|uniref:RNase H type-1 domain-containing protein n=1 Tax=Exocentrus adspersus TaxID=1586481 RepID=A0AAV8W6E5_9CUCU|nr:hypothetical protein NQ315_010495 [Exocentrus adspersus]
MRNEYSGAGIYLENSGVQQSYSLGSYATVFQAEVFAILMVAQREDVKNCTEERIFICSDSQAALSCKDKINACSGVRRYPGVFSQAEEGGVCLDPGTYGIPENERADQLARLGSGEPPQGPEPILGILRGNGPDMSKTVWLLNLGRRALNQMVGILTGHSRLRRHLHLMGIEESPLCPECEEGEDTLIHLLGHCIAFGRLRRKVFGTGELQGGGDG